MKIKLKLMLEGIVKSLKYSVPVVVTMCFISCILMVVLTNMNSDKNNKIESSKEIYGDYHFFLRVNNELKKYINENENVDKVYYLKYRLVKGKDENFYSYIDAKSDLLSNTQYKLVEGRLPQNKNEIIVPRWYLYKIGISPDEMLGCEIEVPFYEESLMEMRKKSVTGILDDMPSGYESSHDKKEIVFGILMDDDFNCNYEDAYVRLKDPKKVFDFVDQIKKDYLMDEDEGDLNEKYNYFLLDALEVTERGHEEASRQQKLFFLIEIIIMTVCIITVFQVLKLFFQNIKDDILIFRMLGVCDGILACCISVILQIFMIIGAFIGSVIGLLIVRKLGFYIEQQMYIPWEKYMCVVIVNGIAMFLFVSVRSLKLIIKEYSMTDLGINTEFFSIKSVMSIGCLCSDTLFVRTKMIRRNIVLNIVRKTVSFIVCVATIIMIVLVFSQTKEQLRYTDDNYEYKYRIQVNYKELKDDMFDVEELYGNIKKVLKDYKCKYYIGESRFAQQCFYKSEMDDAFVKILSRDMGKKNGSKYIDNIECDMYVMGYSKEMMMELCEKNNIEVPGEYEAIFLNRSVNRDNTFSGGINISNGRIFGFDFYLLGYDREKNKKKYFKEHPEEYTHIDFSVKGMVSELPVYPEESGNYIVMIINEDIFEYCFKKRNFPEYIYVIDENEDLIKRISALGSGTDYIHIVDQEDEIRDVNKDYIKRIIGYVFVAIFTGIFAIFNSIITTRMEYELKRKDLTVYRLLGVSRFTILFIQLMEVIVLDAASIAVGVYAAKRLIEYLTLKGILYATSITGKEIVAMVAFGAVLMLSKIICITLNYHRDERKNVIC